MNRLPSGIIFKTTFFSFLPLSFPSPLLSSFLCLLYAPLKLLPLLQLLVEDTTQGHLVSSSPPGGQATTKIPWVVSGSLRPSWDAPSRLALTGLYDSTATSQPLKQRHTLTCRVTKSGKGLNSWCNIITYCAAVVVYLHADRHSCIYPFSLCIYSTCTQT